MILDEFELLKKLGEGAFATVWAARRVDAPPNASGDRARKLYAVKHLKAATDPATGQDLLTTAEFRSLRAIPRHPNVLRPVQVARERGQVFLVTEWCESDVLKTLEAAKARGEIGLPESSVAGVGRGLLRALAHCHAHGWAHRDVKPENILIADGAVRLADFGEAAETSAESGDDVSLRETYVGTRWYRAPEQFLPRGVWEKAPGNAHARDVWAAGCVMGECLLGARAVPRRGRGGHAALLAELVGEDAARPTPRSVRDAWADAAGGDCLPRGPGRFEETFNVQRSTGHCVSNGSGVSNECLALLREMLRVDPARRITAARAAEHPFFAKRAETRVEEEPPRRTAAGSAAGVPGSIPDARGGTKAAARAAALRRLREVSDSSSDDEFDFDEGDAAASAPAPRAAPPSAALDAAVPAEPTAEARAAMAEIRARVASGTETGTETTKRGPKRGPNPRRRGSNLRRLRRRRTTPPRASPRLCARRAWTTPPAATTSSITRPRRRFRRRRAGARAREDAFSDDAVMR